MTLNNLYGQRCTMLFIVSPGAKQYILLYNQPLLWDNKVHRMTTESH